MSAPASPLVTLTQPRSAAAEAFRTLRANLTFSAMEQPLATLLMTSAANEEAKGLVLANLAVSLAQGGRRTILVDADLRRPAQHTIFGLSNERGLTNLLNEGVSGSLPLADVGVDGLSVLPSGPLPSMPADLIGSRRMDEVIAALKPRADLVLFDAPPILAVSDAALLATKVDAALLVVSAGATQREHAQRAKELLEKIHVRLLGAVLANAPSASRGRLDGAYA